METSTSVNVVKKKRIEIRRMTRVVAMGAGNTAQIEGCLDNLPISERGLFLHFLKQDINFGGRVEHKRATS